MSIPHYTLTPAAARGLSPVVAHGPSPVVAHGLLPTSPNNSVDSPALNVCTFLMHGFSVATVVPHFA